MTGGTDEVRALDAAAVRSLQAGQPRVALDGLETALRLTRDDLGVWMNVAAARWMLGELDLAAVALEEALRLDPRCFLALLMKASLAERRQGLRAAGAVYGAALAVAPDPASLDPTSRAALARASERKARYDADLAAAMGSALEGAAGQAARRGRGFIDYSLGLRRRYAQEPVQFYYPGLPPIPFWDREEFPWLAELEASTGDIAAELAAVMDDRAGFAPYIRYPEGVPLNQWAELNRSPRWSAYHILADGRPVAGHAERCPRTLAALAPTDQPDVAGRSPVAMFSALRPKTRIPPHTGVSNTRLVVHLPLVVPPGCGFRVGGETREWKVGEAWVFDDTIEHEAWNDSDQDRVILIFDVWNPRLSADDRAIIARATAAMDAFHGASPAGGAEPTAQATG